MEYMSPIGKIRMGRTSSGLWQGSFLSSDKNNNRLMYFPNFLPKPWGACVFLQKTVEADSQSTDNDSDYDLYEASAWYKSKDLVAAIGYDWFDDDRDSDFNISKHLIKGYYNQNFGNIYAETEFAYVYGTKDIFNEVPNVSEDQDYDSFAIQADVGMTMDKMDIGFLAFYATGDSDSSNGDDLTAALSASAEGNGLGEQFQPYVILTGASTGMLVGDYNSANAAMVSAGVVSLGMHADFAVTDKLSLHSAIGWAQAADTEQGTDGQDKDYGWEVDLGVSYSLMDNLTYAVDFGYLATGDFFAGNDVSQDYSTEDVIVLNHRLTMEF
jgi:hypothetical protein